MKNLTVKKVALGLFLAGYAASSAFALSATSNNTIFGNAPIMKSLANGAANHTMTLRITQDEAGNTPIITQNNPNAKPKVGNYIHIKYKLTDVDGDKDAGEELKKTLSVSVKRNEGDTWAPVTIAPKITHVDDETATISFKITADFAGMNYIGYNITERTDFGQPIYGQWLRVNNIFSDKAPDSSTAATESNKNLTEIIAGEDRGPGDIENISGPVEGDNMNIAIFRIGSDGAPEIGVNYSKSDTTQVPKYGEKYTAVVWNEDGSVDDVLTQQEFNNELTASYKFKWTVVGTNVFGKDSDGKEFTAAEGVSTRKGTNDTILLGTDKTDGTKHNSIYGSHGYNAGIQGFILKVETTK